MTQKNAKLVERLVPWVALVVILAGGFLTLAVILSGCVVIQPPKPTASCEEACQRGRALSCEWAEPTPGGIACEVVCTDADTPIPWNRDCIVKAESCEAAESCQRK